MGTQRPSDPASRLRLARESKGLSYRQIADATKLSARAAEALETGRFSVLPAGIYRRAIVRSVAAEVGLDPDRLLADFASAFPNEFPPPDLPQVIESPAPVLPSRSRAVALLGVALPVLGALGYMLWPHRSATLPPIPSKPVLSSRSAEVLPAGGFQELSAAEPRTITITLTISSRCRLRVLADGRELLGRVVEAGERVPIELGDELVLSGDDASAVQFSINGRAGRQLGVPGDALAVRIGRDDYESFLARY
ncbi:MAG: helix-turn-helix domain-containing protein [Vicinamibacterales bacterium]